MPDFPEVDAVTRRIVSPAVLAALKEQLEEAGVSGSGPSLAQVGALTLPASPATGETVTVLADSTTALPTNATWDNGGAPVITAGARLLVQLVWSGSDWVGTYGIPFNGGTVTAADPTFTDASGTANDRYTVPASPGVVYSKGGSPIGAGTYTPTAGETVTITAAAAANYTLTGTASWTHTFSTSTANTAPSITLGSATITGANVSQPFTTYDADGNTVTVTANWGDGASGVVTSPATHTYATNGTYTAAFTPNDGTANGAAGSAQYTISTVGLPPVGNPATLADAMVTYGALGYWKLNETSGTTLADSSGNGRNLTLAGTPTTDYVLAGKDGLLQLNAATAVAEGLTGPTFSTPSGGHLTVFALTHLLNTSGGSARSLVAKDGVVSQAEWKMLVNSRNPQAMINRANPSVMLAYSYSSVPLPANAWAAIAATLPNDAALRPTVYQNSGTPVAVTSGSTGTGRTGNGTSPIRIGGGFRGAVGHVAVFPWELTGAHIQKLVDLARAEGLIP